MVVEHVHSWSIPFQCCYSLGDSRGEGGMWGLSRNHIVSNPIRMYMENGAKYMFRCTQRVAILRDTPIGEVWERRYRCDHADRGQSDCHQRHSDCGQPHCIHNGQLHLTECWFRDQCSFPLHQLRDIWWMQVSFQPNQLQHHPACPHILRFQHSLGTMHSLQRPPDGQCNDQPLSLSMRAVTVHDDPQSDWLWRIIPSRHLYLRGDHGSNWPRLPDVHSNLHIASTSTLKANARSQLFILDVLHPAFTLKAWQI